MVVFAPHDIIQDPPFLHLEYLSCRNLLIYFEPVLQRKVLETFSKALNPSGILFLGESETITGFEDSYIPVDPKRKIYRRKPYAPATPAPGISVSTPAGEGNCSKGEGTGDEGPNVNEKAEGSAFGACTAMSDGVGTG